MERFLFSTLALDPRSRQYTMSYSSGGSGYAGGNGGRGGRDRDLVDKFKSVNWRGLGRNISNKVKQYAMNLSPLEIQTEEGTRGSVTADAVLSHSLAFTHVSSLRTSCSHES